MFSSLRICHPVLKEEAEFKMLLYVRCLSCFYWSDMYSLINLASVASAFINSYQHKLRQAHLIELHTQNFPPFSICFRRLISKLTKHYLLSQEWYHCIFPSFKWTGVVPPGECWVLISDQASLLWYLWVYPNSYGIKTALRRGKPPVGMECRSSPPRGEGLSWIMHKKKKPGLAFLCSVILNTHTHTNKY